MNTSSILIRSEFTAAALHRKLRLCGSRTFSGHWYWCRSPACDRCRRYRAHMIANAVSDWSAAQSSRSLRVMSIRTAAFDDPVSLLAGIHHVRLQLRGIFDRRQRQNERWIGLKAFGIFAPSFDGRWSAQCRGLFLLGRLHELSVLDAIEPLISIRLDPLSEDHTGMSVHALMLQAVTNTSSLLGCNGDQIASWFNAVDELGGFKSLIYR